MRETIFPSQKTFSGFCAKHFKDNFATFFLSSFYLPFSLRSLPALLVFCKHFIFASLADIKANLLLLPSFEPMLEKRRQREVCPTMSWTWVAASLFIRLQSQRKVFLFCILWFLEIFYHFIPHRRLVSCISRLSKSYSSGSIPALSP